MDQQPNYNLRKWVTLTQRAQESEGLPDLYLSQWNEDMSVEQPFNIESKTKEGSPSPDDQHLWSIDVLNRERI